MPGFYGLDDDYMLDVYEQFFSLKYYGGWSFTEAYNLPIKLREWFLARLIRQKKEEQEAAEAPSSSTSVGRTELGPGVKVPKV